MITDPRGIYCTTSGIARYYWQPNSCWELSTSTCGVSMGQERAKSHDACILHVCMFGPDLEQNVQLVRLLCARTLKRLCGGSG